MTSLKAMTAVLLISGIFAGFAITTTAQAAPLDVACAGAVAANYAAPVSIQPATLNPVLTPALVVTPAPVAAPVRMAAPAEAAR